MAYILGNTKLLFSDIESPDQSLPTEAFLFQVILDPASRIVFQVTSVSPCHPEQTKNSNPEKAPQHYHSILIINGLQKLQ